MEKSGTRTLLRIIALLSILAGMYALYTGKEWIEWFTAFMIGGSLYVSTYNTKNMS